MALAYLLEEGFGSTVRSAVWHLGGSPGGSPGRGAMSRARVARNAPGSLFNGYRHRTDTGAVLYGYYTGPELVFWYFSGATLVLFRDDAGTAKALQWYCRGTAVVLQQY